MVASQPQGKSAAAFSTVVKAREQGLTSLLERGVLAEDLTPGCKARMAFAVPASICGAGSVECLVSAELMNEEWAVPLQSAGSTGRTSRHPSHS